MIPCPQYCAPVLSSVINMEGLEPCISRSVLCLPWSRRHRRMHRWPGFHPLHMPLHFLLWLSPVMFFTKKKHGMIWENKLPSLFQMIQKSEVGNKLQHALRQWLLKRNLLHYLWLNIPGSGCRERGNNIETSSPQPIQHSWAGGLTRWFADENTRTKGHSAVFLDLLDVFKANACVSGHQHIRFPISKNKIFFSEDPASY